MLQKLKAGACCLALSLVMAVQVNAAETEVEETTPAFDPMADSVLIAADAYLQSLQSFSVQAETLRDIVTDEGEIITYTTQLDLSIVRPDRLYLKRVGVLRNQEIFYNGTDLVVHSLRHKVYAREQVPPTISEMLDYVTGEYGLQLPGSDLLRRDLYDGMMSAATSGVYLGTVAVDGVECHHLAYRGDEVDFQLWIEAGDEPKPKRLLIVSKELTAAPRYMFNLTSLKSAEFTKDLFEFTPPAGENRIRFLREQEVEQVKEAVKEAQ